ncbi:hypothetical protein C443_00072 [Haloarcula argentinensis DSM 12282]|nr:hypothetical protein C443_00072 [Haloarcula argentinensis DSM 12282]
MVVPDNVRTTQWHLRRAYEDSAIDSDELVAVQVNCWMRSQIIHGRSGARVVKQRVPFATPTT